MSSLFSPIRLGEVTLENRIAVSPMCQYSANDGCATEWHIAHDGMLANSGAGLLVIEATHVERHGRITHGCLGLYSDDCEAALQRVVSYLRRHVTAKLGIQLAHAGRKGSSRRPWEGGQGLKAGEDPWETIAPSALAFGADWATPREMDEDDITRVREAFADASRRAVRLGFDAIELHAAHGYLIHEFISPVSNKRSDQYGGSAEARMRFPREVAQAVRAVVPKSVALGARIRSQGHGVIVALSSVAGERPRRSNFVYGSTKAGMDAFYTGLGEALRDFGGRALVVRPGFVRSKMTEGLDAAPLATTPEEVAEAVVAAVRDGKQQIWVPGTMRAVMSGLRHLPRPVFRRLPI